MNKVIPESAAAFEMGGEGIWGNTTPAVTVIVSAGAIFALGGAGLATTKFPPIAVITGDAIGGFVLAGATPQEVFEAWILSGQAFEPSCWSGFNFNSFAQHRGQTYAAGEDGNYLLGGENDAGETIHTGARIGPVDFRTDRNKRIRGIQYGQGGKNTRVRVESDEGNVGVFTPERDDNRVVVSRNIQGAGIHHRLYGLRGTQSMQEDHATAVGQEVVCFTQTTLRHICFTQEVRDDGL